MVKEYAAGVLDVTRHLYFTEPSKWQVVEERQDGSSDAYEQFVWGLRYMDDVVLRDRDTTGDATLDERLYGLQDANWNVTSISDTGGTIQERYAYTAYGTPAFLDSSFNSRASSNYAWETLFAGYRWDDFVEMFHVRNRILLVHLGTWGQRDPLGLAAGVNLYEYVLSNPGIFTDPMGQVVPLVAIAALIACLVGAATTIWGDLDKSGWNLLCKSVGGCLVGLATAFGIMANPAFAGCIGGLGLGVAKFAVGPICDKWTDEWDCDDTVACLAFKSLFFGIFGCLLQFIPPSTIKEKILIAIDVFLWKKVVDKACKIV